MTHVAGIDSIKLLIIFFCLRKDFISFAFWVEEVVDYWMKELLR